VVAIIALLLAIQGVNAVSMPFCEHGPGASTSLADAERHAGMIHADHVHVQNEGHDAGHDNGETKLAPDTQSKNDLACDDCEFCALSCASTLPSAELVGGASAGHGARSSHETLLIGVTPHHLSKPPLLA